MFAIDLNSIEIIAKLKKIAKKDKQSDDKNNKFYDLNWSKFVTKFGNKNFTINGKNINPRWHNDWTISAFISVLQVFRFVTTLCPGGDLGIYNMS